MTWLYKFEAAAECTKIKHSLYAIDCETLDGYCLYNGAEIEYWELNKLFINKENSYYMYSCVNNKNEFCKRLMVLFQGKIKKYSALLKDAENKYNFIKSNLPNTDETDE